MFGPRHMDSPALEGLPRALDGASASTATVVVEQPMRRAASEMRQIAIYRVNYIILIEPARVRTSKHVQQS
jgi:hypothetical protein